MGDSSSLLVVRDWRIARAEPSGSLMWFDPLREAPMLRYLTPDERRMVDPFYEGGALDGTTMGRGVVPCEGSDPSMAKTDLEDDLPF